MQSYYFLLKWQNFVQNICLFREKVIILQPIKQKLENYVNVECILLRLLLLLYKQL